MAELIVALDHSDAPSAIALLDQLPEGCAVKVGAVLFTSAGPGFVRALVAEGHPVFLDLKWYDIPNTVAGAVRSAVDLGVEMATVHAAGGPAMLAAAAAAAGDRVKLVAVTVLTSFAAPEYAAVTGRDLVDLGAEVTRLATLAVAAGMAGVVCSAEELAVARPAVGSGRLVVPGIRRAEDGAGDQRRVATPEGAVLAGATHLVVGRPISDAPNPAEAYDAFRRAMPRPIA
ncbi:MAG TPA: orotidine-5'-phosphate decarboxylase [Gemmatimonadales bacterium]|nr:orotidine-5'-phosphate decarboxylase [Gemmatimonadales bacterium]